MKRHAFHALRLALCALLTACGTAPKVKQPALTEVPADHAYVHYVHIVHDYPQLVEWLGQNTTGGYNLIKSKGKLAPATNPVTP